MWPFLSLQNGGNSPQKKTFGYIISIYFIFSKKWLRFMMISMIELKCFQINLTLDFFMSLRLE
jgi:hypothetical protein